MREAESREAERREAKSVEIVGDAGGIAGVDAMSSGDVAASVRMLRRRSIVRSRAGSIRQRLCCRR
jgi:hypothetical protein